MNDSDFSISTVDLSVPSLAQGEANNTLRCPKCGRPVDSLCCGHCGSQLPAEQADLYGAIVKKIAKLGGNRADATKKGGILGETVFREPIGKQDTGSATPEARTRRHEDPDGQEYDETIANDLRQVECPYCGKSFPI